MDVETFVVVGGRRPVADLPVEIGGDHELGRKVLEAMAVDPVTKAEWTPDEIPDLDGQAGTRHGCHQRHRRAHSAGACTRRRAGRDERAVRAGSSTPRSTNAARASGADLVPLILDLADLLDQRAAEEAASFGPIDIPINNAGHGHAARRTVDGFEL